MLSCNCVEPIELDNGDCGIKVVVNITIPKKLMSYLDKRKLFTLVCKFGLSKWHFKSAIILEKINGYKNAEKFLMECNKIKKRKKYLNKKCI